MNITEICNNVFYVGVNDRVTERFESLWPLPLGVSYNSYIVKGTEKIALIDTVEIGEINGYLNEIRNIIGESPIDYVVINHMEPDHSGGIPAVLARYPKAKLIGNKQTLSIVKGFYNIPAERMLEIIDDETISLGDKTLRFRLTPMVHWPETMMTYVEEDGVLFSGDAFGTFGALNGGVTDTEMDTDWYGDEMRRYYSNIVAKYGRFVLKALDKTKDLDIKYLCSTHGPVWNSRIQEVVELYRSMGSYESENGVTIVYGSMYGNTASMAEDIARELAARGVRKIKIHNASRSEMSYIISDAFRYKGLVVCAPTYSMHLYPPVEQFMIAMQTREIKNKVLALAGSFTWASAAAKSLRQYAETMKIAPVAEIEMKQTINEDIKAKLADMADKIVAALAE